MKRAGAAVENLSMSNAFTLFGLPICFQIDLVELDKRYLKAQQMVHPDMFAGRSDMEKRIAANQAVTLNEAYQRLKNIPSRAEEFLKAKGVNIPGREGTTVPASPFLMQVIQWRERIEEGDNLPALKTELCQRLEACKEKFDHVEVAYLADCYLSLIYIFKTLEELEGILKNHADPTC